MNLLNMNSNNPKNKVFKSLGLKDLDASVSSYLELGAPDRKVEDWKYTDISKLKDQELDYMTNISDLEKDPEVVSCVGKLDNELVFINGVYSQTLSNVQTSSDVQIFNLKDVFLEKENFSFESQFKKIVKSTAIKNDSSFFFSHLSWKNIFEGTFIFVKSNAQIKKPLKLTHINKGSEGKTYFCNVKNMIYLEGGSQIEVLEEFVGLGEKSTLSCPSVEAYLEPRARFTYFKTQKENQESYQFHNMIVNVEKESRVEVYELSVGSKLNKNYVQVNELEEGAEALVGGFYYTQGAQHQDHQILVNHEKPHGYSRQIVKGILDDHSRVIFNGKIYIAEKAQKVNSSQLNQNITLSSRAEVDTKPELEILADDVSAQHGATVGELDLSQVFYLMSRGISRREALSMLVQGFALETLEDFSNSLLKKEFIAEELKVLMKKLEDNWVKES